MICISCETPRAYWAIVSFLKWREPGDIQAGEYLGPMNRGYTTPHPRWVRGPHRSWLGPARAPFAPWSSPRGSDPRRRCRLGVVAF